MTTFDVDIRLLQPTDQEDSDGRVIEYGHDVLGRLVRKQARNVGFRDSAFTSAGDDVYDIFDPPAGIGTIWHASIGGVRYRILGSAPVRGRRKVMRLYLESTEPTGEVRVSN